MVVARIVMMDVAAIDFMLRAASKATGQKRFVLVGSAAVVAWRTKVPGIMAMTPEIDIYSLGDDAERDSEIIDANLGQDTRFHATHGFFVDGVEPRTARLPEGWRDRTHVFRTSDNAVTALIPEPDDIAASKLVRCSPKDLDFIVAGVKFGIFNLDTVIERALSLDIADLNQGTMEQKVEILRGRLAPGRRD